MIHCRKWACLAVSLGLTALAYNSAAAQNAGDGPPSETSSITTKDGVQLRVTYFPSPARKGTTQAKQATPVVLLHDFKSTRTIFTPLAAKLQASSGQGGDKPSFAVLLVDLRAHGESTKQLTAEGAAVNLDAAKLSKEDLAKMAGYDMEAARGFLVQKNDAGELNLNKLCLVGSGMGAGVAANWALQDWTAPPLAVGKQGQDVKAIVMISPRWTFNGLSMQDPLKFGPLKQNVAWMLICGAQDPKVKTDLQRIQKLLERSHPSTGKTGAEQNSGLVVLALPSSLQGDQLLTQLGDQVADQVVNFLLTNVAVSQLPWADRSKLLP